MKKLHLSLLLCMSLSYSLQAGDITQAIRNLNIAQVEKELKAYSELDPDYKLKLLTMIDKKIIELQKQQNLKNKYLNPQTIFGILTGVLAKGIYTRFNSDYVIDTVAAGTTAYLRDMYNNLTENNLGNIERAMLAEELKNVQNRTLWKVGSMYRALTGILALMSAKLLYNGLTTKNLKNNYAKALAIKALLQQVPTQ